MKTMKHVLLAGVTTSLPARAHSALNFDATTVAPSTGFEPLPAGWYNAAIDESEVKPTNAGDGTYLKLRFNILDGQYAGRKIFYQCNLKNPNPQAAEIGQRELSAICHAIGVLRPAQSEELHNLPLKIKLKYKPAEGQYSEGNEIQSFKSKDEKVDMAGGDSAAGHPGAGVFGGGAPASPWEKGAASEVAGAPAGAEGGQPWAAGGQAGAPAAPTPPAPPAETTPPPPPAAHDPLEAAVKDGWIKHPSAPGYHYKGQDVKLDADVAAMYPAPPAAPEAPAAPPPPPTAPSAPESPQAPAAADAGTPAPPWATPKA